MNEGLPAARPLAAQRIGTYRKSHELADQQHATHPSHRRHRSLASAGGSGAFGSYVTADARVGKFVSASGRVLLPSYSAQQRSC